MAQTAQERILRQKQRRLCGHRLWYRLGKDDRAGAFFLEIELDGEKTARRLFLGDDLQTCEGYFAVLVRHAVFPQHLGEIAEELVSP